jgi:glyoxylase-like metal-dependent hydrolase (beta-lactamase superfamily II)
MPPSDAPQIELLHDQPPPQGRVIRITDGLLWTRLPLPFRLNHVNVWFLGEDDGWTVIDSGCDTTIIRQTWEALLDKPLKRRKLVRHVATHGHTDHIGLSGWLTERFDMPYISTLTEWMAPQVRLMEGPGDHRNETEKHLRELGCGNDVIERLKNDRTWAGSLIYPMPSTFERIRNDDEITFGGRRWRVITAGGHAAEHASFFCADEGILIAGDQILPTISPMIGVFSQEPFGNPLADYLASMDRFRELPEDTVVLPSHGLPFTGLHTRIDQLVDHHHARLDLLESLMERPATGMELAAGLFPKAVNEGHARLALAETVAHINYLVAEGRAERGWDRQGLLRFTSVAAKRAPRAIGTARRARRAR